VPPRSKLREVVSEGNGSIRSSLRSLSSVVGNSTNGMNKKGEGAEEEEHLYMDEFEFVKSRKGFLSLSYPDSKNFWSVVLLPF